MGCDGGTGLKGCREMPLKRDTIITHTHLDASTFLNVSYVGSVMLESAVWGTGKIAVNPVDLFDLPRW